LCHSAFFSRPTKPKAPHGATHAIAEAKIGAYRERSNNRGATPVRRYQQNSFLYGTPNRSEGQLITVENDLAAICSVDARNRPKKMAVTGALNAGDADDPSG
jgi:hypothetical protein